MNALNASDTCDDTYKKGSARSASPVTSVARPAIAASPRATRRGIPLLSLAGAALGLLLCLLLVGCSASQSTLSRGPQQTSNAPSTSPSGAQATAGSAPQIALPLNVSAPGCGASSADWIVQSAEGRVCLSNPSRLQLVGEPYASSFCCENEVELPFGSNGQLPSTFRVTTEMSGLVGQAQAGDLIARLVVRLEPGKGLTGASPVLIAGLTVGGDGSVSYSLGLSGKDGHGTLDAATLSRPLSVSITVDAYSASIALGGATYLQRPVTTPVTVAGIALQMVGPSGSSVEFSNLKVEQVTGGAPIFS